MLLAKWQKDCQILVVKLASQLPDSPAQRGVVKGELSSWQVNGRSVDIKEWAYMFRKDPQSSKSKHPARSRERGYVLLTMACAIIALCGFAGLVVDCGYGEYLRRQAQAAADAGAKEAGFQLSAGATSSLATMVQQDTASNGFTDGSSSSQCTSSPRQAGCVTVTVNNPPTQGNYAGNSNYAEVIVQKVVGTNFMGILGFPTM